MNERAITAFYQPIVRPSDLTVVAYEVLARSSLFGLKTPDLMFEAAAQLNLEAELSRVCRRVGLEKCPNSSVTPNLFLNTHPTESAGHRHAREVHAGGSRGFPLARHYAGDP